MEFFLPSWLDNQRMNPEHFSLVYTETDSRLRARLKTAIAWQFSVAAESSVHETHSILGPDRAFLTTVTESAADLAVFFLDAEHHAPASLLAAVLPAILAGVLDIMIICLDGLPSAGNCLAMELAGIENVFILHKSGQYLSMIEEWLEELTQKATVNCLFFGADHKTLANLYAKCTKLIPTWIWLERPLSAIGIKPGSSDFFKMILAWAHGSTVQLLESDPQTLPVFYSEQDMVQDMRKNCQQAYGPGLEACLRHPDLDRPFFRRIRINAYLTDKSNHG